MLSFLSLVFTSQFPPQPSETLLVKNSPVLTVAAQIVDLSFFLERAETANLKFHIVEFMHLMMKSAPVRLAADMNIDIVIGLIVRIGRIAKNVK